MSELLLWPAPRELRADGEGPRRADVRLRTEPDASLPAQGYELRIDAEGAVLRHADDAGRRYGTQTFDQIAEQSDETLPALTVRDHPDLVHRGYMLDISRDRVPTRETLARIVEVLEQARFTHLQLYTEHTFAYRDHRVVWEHASPMTPEDVRWLDERCAEAGIELAANQNCFGHMERWLVHEAYRDRAECPQGFDLIPGMSRPPSVLRPTPDNAAFVGALFEELLPNFRSHTVNVGCDETFELGRCASAAEVAERGKHRVYVDHLRRIVEPLLERGHAVQFWADVARAEPALLDPLRSGDVTALAWTYEQPRAASEMPELPAPIASILADLGIDFADAHAGFARNAGPLAASGFPFWVCPGTSSWNSLVGRLDNARGNILDAVSVAIDHAAPGMLLTDWGDNGHLQPPAVSLPPIAYAGAVAWCRYANADLDLPAVLNRHVLRDAGGVLGGALERMGLLWSRLGQRGMNGSPLQAALCPGQFHFVTGMPDIDAVRDAAQTLEAIAGELDAARPDVPDAAIVVRELRLAARLARHGALRLAGGSDRSALRADMRELVDEHRACWLERSRPGGLDDSAAHLEATLASYAD